MQNFPDHKVSIREASRQDLDTIFEILQESGLQAWSRESLRRFVNRRGSLFRVLVKEETCLGFALSRLISDEMEILILAVARGSRSRGYGHLLLRDTLREAFKSGIRRCFLEVRAGNKPAVNLYLRNNFQVNRVRNGYYVESDEDAWVMSRRLDPRFLF